MLLKFPDKLPSVIDSANYLVIGSGIAGLYAALELSRSGRVILLTKSTLSESNTTYAQGGIAAAIGIMDSPELHYQDTMVAGAGLCDRQAVLALVYDGPDRVRNLLELGVPFDHTSEGLSLTREAAHSRRRILHADGDATGRVIAQTLIERVRENPAIIIQENCYVLAPIMAEGRCCGVVVVKENELGSYLGGVVILASGGLGQLFGKTTNPAIATGDGLAIAYYAGTVLRDLEFIQFHPTALYLPPAPSFLISEAVRGEGAFLLNQHGERFMFNYHPQGELAPRDIVARAIFAEIQKTGHPCVYLDLSQIGATRIADRFPNIFRRCRGFGLDITEYPIPVAPAAHYMMGGVAADLEGRTTIPGLYAIGEVACTGVHGANRLASNSLLEGLVFANRCADKLAQDPPPPPVQTDTMAARYPECLTPFASHTADREKLNQLADTRLGISRDAQGLQEALTILRGALKPKPGFELDLKYFELQNLWLLAIWITEAALLRTESRGGHFRSDFPVPSSEWRQHINLRNGQLEVEA
jgi:L-aspartate oxidase